MADDWKNAYQRKLDEELRKRLEGLERERAAEERKKQELERKKEIEEQRAREKWGKRYKCHICDHPSQYKQSVYDCVYGLKNDPIRREIYTKMVKWFGEWADIPLDLNLCEKCRKLCCSKHIYIPDYKIGVCQRCAGY